MNRTRYLLLAMVTACFALGATAAPKSQASDKATARAVKSLYDRWTSAFEKKDLVALMACYDQDVVFSMQGQDDLGLAGIRDAFRVDFASREMGATWLPHTEKIYSDGALIVVVARWDYLDKTPAGKVEVVYRIRSVDILTPGADGLKILHTVNYPLDPPN